MDPRCPVRTALRPVDRRSSTSDRSERPARPIHSADLCRAIATCRSKAPLHVVMLPRSYSLGRPCAAPRRRDHQRAPTEHHFIGKQDNAPTSSPIPEHTITKELNWTQYGKARSHTSHQGRSIRTGESTGRNVPHTAHPNTWFAASGQVVFR